ncbi:hypothetical protein EDD11_000380, partial [Mortierella claussenii]
MLASARVSAVATASIRRTLVASSTSASTAAAGRRLFSASTIQRAAHPTPSSGGNKGGSSWLTIAGLTALAATSGYYLFSPVDAKVTGAKSTPSAASAAPVPAPAPEKQTSPEVLAAENKKTLQNMTVIFVL